MRNYQNNGDGTMTDESTARPLVATTADDAAQKLRGLLKDQPTLAPARVMPPIGHAIGD